jgi:DNA mismatch repair protein MLH1
MRELAYFHVPGPLPIDGEPMQLDDNDNTEAQKAERWQIQHILLPAMRRYLIAPKRLLDADITQVASLPDLYRVFERC